MRSLLTAALVFTATTALAAEPPTPKPDDTCAVCGMFVAKYPEWVASAVFGDGTTRHFDGPKDLFKFLFDVPRFARGHTRDDVASLWVTDYYGVRRVEAKVALYAVGSDVLGPMGHELVPLATRAEAEEFRRDHKATRILSFAEVTPDIVKALDAPKKR